MSQHGDTRLLARSAAGIYAGAMVIGVIEDLLPGGPSFSVVPVIAALFISPMVALFGHRVPRRVLALLGPVGASLIAVALASTHDATDGAVMYMWPVVWMAHFYGRRGAAFIVAWVALVHGTALVTMPPEIGNADRFIDVVVSIVVVAAVVRALSERSDQLVARLAAEARVDPLTGLLNRRGFDEQLAGVVARANRYGGTLAVASFDLDHFKRVNDERGHDAGDRALAAVGALIAGSTRAGDLAARAGGEEFVVVLPGAGRDAALAFAERVRASVPDVAGGLTLSAGVAVATAPLDWTALLGASDAAMYAAKQAGRNRTVVAGTTEPDPVRD